MGGTRLGAASAEVACFLMAVIKVLCVRGVKIRLQENAVRCTLMQNLGLVIFRCRLCVARVRLDFWDIVPAVGEQQCTG